MNWSVNLSQLVVCLSLYFFMKVILQVVILQLQVNVQLKKVHKFQNTVKRGNNDSFVLICSFRLSTAVDIYFCY